MDEHIGVFNKLWHNFEINKPMFEMANSVRFTEYLRAIFKSLPPNIYISTSASRFVMFKNGAYMNANEGQMYVGIHRYPPSYQMSLTVLLNVM